MARRQHARDRRTLLLWALLLAVFSAAVLVLAAYARMRIHSPERGRIEVIIAGARDRAKGYKEEVRLAREKLPPDAGIPKDWDCRQFVSSHFNAAWWRYELAKALVQNPRSIGHERLRNVLQYRSNRSSLPAFLQSADPEKDLGEEATAEVRRYFRALPELQEFEKGFTHGLCGNSCFDGPAYMPSLTSPFAARAVSEALDGQSELAVETCLTAYRLATLATRLPVVWGYEQFCDANETIDRALWRVADAAEQSNNDWRRLLSMIDARRPAKPLADVLRIDAACREMGLSQYLEERDDRLGSTFIMLLSGGAMQIADEFIEKLERPPYDCGITHQDLVESYRHLGRFALPLPVFRVQSLRACISYVESVARADAAHLAFALKAWKKAHGAYPPTLEAMDPKPPEADLRDPDTGKPVIYERCGTEGFRVYAGDPRQETLTLWEASN